MLGVLARLGRADLRIDIVCPAAQGGKGIMVAEPGGVGRVATVPGQSRVETEERHDGQGPVSTGVAICVVVVRGQIELGGWRKWQARSRQQTRGGGRIGRSRWPVVWRRD